MMVCTQNQNKLVGKMEIGDVIVEYLWYTGAERTVISEELYYKLKLTSDRELESYKGPKLSSANKNIKILGTLKIPKCVLSNEISIYNVDVIVINDLQHFEFLMGMDLLRTVPNFAQVHKLQCRRIEQTDVWFRRILEK